jgi:hypothetical protein
MGYLNNLGLFSRKKDDISQVHTYCPPRGSYGKRTQVDDMMDYLGTGKVRHIECKSPGELSDLLYQKWLEIASPEELEEFNVNPSTMLKLDQYEKHYNLQLKHQILDKQLEKQILDICSKMIEDDLREEEEKMYQNLIEEERKNHLKLQKKQEIDREWTKL